MKSKHSLKTGKRMFGSCQNCQLFRQKNKIMLRGDTVCPKSSDPFHIVSYYINGSLLLGHTVVAVHVSRRGRRIQILLVACSCSRTKHILTKWIKIWRTLLFYPALIWIQIRILSNTEFDPYRSSCTRIQVHNIPFLIQVPIIKPWIRIIPNL